MRVIEYRTVTPERLDSNGAVCVTAVVEPREVELTSAEIVAQRVFEAILGEGLGIPDAVTRVRSLHPGLDDEFYTQWLAK